jgi:hypothetical protein
VLARVRAAYLVNDAYVACLKPHALHNTSSPLLQGGFQAEMTKREAALILGLRESAAADKVKDAHRKIMIANHPDSGGSSFLATKVNEAKEMMLGKGRRRTNVF